MKEKLLITTFGDYSKKLITCLEDYDWTPVQSLAEELINVWNSKRNLFLCGNGGSAANAMHLATDLIYGAGCGQQPGLKVHALTSNAAVMTCLANDTSYEEIFSYQLNSLSTPGDVLIVFSGSGNSKNILHVLEKARSLGVTTWAILGFSGGKAKSLADHAIHFAVDDMQISEDLQMIVGHMLMKALSATLSSTNNTSKN